MGSFYDEMRKRYGVSTGSAPKKTSSFYEEMREKYGTSFVPARRTYENERGAADRIDRIDTSDDFGSGTGLRESRQNTGLNNPQPSPGKKIMPVALARGEASVREDYTDTVYQVNEAKRQLEEASVDYQDVEKSFIEAHDQLNAAEKELQMAYHAVESNPQDRAALEDYYARLARYQLAYDNYAGFAEIVSPYFQAQSEYGKAIKNAEAAWKKYAPQAWGDYLASDRLARNSKREPVDRKRNQTKGFTTVDISPDQPEYHSPDGVVRHQQEVYSTIEEMEEIVNYLRTMDVQNYGSDEEDRTELVYKGYTLEQAEKALQDLKDKGTDLTNAAYVATRQGDKTRLEANEEAASKYREIPVLVADTERLYRLIMHISGVSGYEMDPDEREKEVAYFKDAYGLSDDAISATARDNASAQQQSHTKGEPYSSLWHLYWDLNATYESNRAFLEENGFPTSEMFAYDTRLANAKKAATVNTDTKAWATENPWLAEGLRVLANPFTGVEYVGQLLGNIGHNDPKNIESYRPLDHNAMVGTAFVSNVRDAHSDLAASHAKTDIGAAANRFLYSTATSISDSALSTAVFGKASPFVQGSAAAAQTVYQVMAKGGTSTQALGLGTAVGAIEILTEKLSVDNLLDSSFKPKEWARSTLSQFGVEAREELVAETAGIIADAAIMGRKSEFNQAVRRYMARGMTSEQAKQKAFMDCVVQIAVAGLAGGISGGVTGGFYGGVNVVIAQAQQYAQKNLTGKALERMSDRLDALKTASMAKEGTKLAKLVSKIDSALAADNSGRTVSDAMWGQLIQLTEEAVRKGELNIQTAEEKHDALQSIHPNESVMVEASREFMEHGDEAKTADKKGRIFERVLQGDTTLTRNDLRDLKMNDASTRAVFADHGLTVPSTTATQALLDYAQSVVNEVAESNKADAARSALLAQVFRSAQNTPVAEETIPDAPVPAAAAPTEAASSPEEQQARMEELTEQNMGQAGQMLEQAVQQQIAPTTGTVKLDNGEVLDRDTFVQRYMDSHPGVSAEKAEAVYGSYAESTAMGMTLPAAVFDAKSESTAKTSQPAGETRTRGKKRHSLGEDTTQQNSPAEANKTTSTGVDTQQRMVDYINAVLPKGAPEVMLVHEGVDGPNGSWDDATRRIKLNADRLTTASLLEYYLAHELVHDVDHTTGRKMSDIIAEFGKDFYDGTYGPGTWDRMVQEKRVEYAAFYSKQKDSNGNRLHTDSWVRDNTTRKPMEEEVCADVMRDLFHSANMLGRFAAQNTKAAKTIRARVAKLRDRIIGRIVGVGDALIDAGTRTDMGKTIEEILSVMDAALNGRVVNQKTAEAQRKTAEDALLGPTKPRTPDTTRTDDGQMELATRGPLRRSIPNTDSDGRQLSKGQKSYFKNSMTRLEEHTADVGVVFSSEQVKDTTNRNPTTDPDIRFSVDGRPLAQPLYSKMEQVVFDLKGDRLGASSLISTLKNRGVKGEEIKWSGVEQFLAGKKSVTKEELIEFLRANELVIEDVVLSADNEAELTDDDKAEISRIADQQRGLTEMLVHLIDALGDIGVASALQDAVTTDGVYTRHDYHDIANAAKESMEELLNSEKVPTGMSYLDFRRLSKKYDAFGYDYDEQAISEMMNDPESFADLDLDQEDRDALLAYSKAKKKNEAISKDIRENSSYYHDLDHIRSLAEHAEYMWRRRESVEQRVKDYAVERGPQYQEYALNRIDAEKYREVLFRLPQVGDGLYSPHWRQTDVLAHTRLQDMVDAEGKKVLFVDEVQSDWHQAGRDDGYQSENEATAREKFVVELLEGGEDGAEGLYAVFEADDGAPVTEIWAYSESEAYQRMADWSDRGKVPDAPYRDTWHEYVLKRILRMAAEGGYDKVAWTTGQMQADRYHLGQYVDSIDVANNGEGGYFIDVGERRFEDQTPDQVISLLGHDLGRRAMEKADSLTPFEVESLEGADLEIGGEGMKNFYDVGGKSSQNIPKFLNKYLKPWGVKVQSSVVGEDMRKLPAYKEGGVDRVTELAKAGLLGDLSDRAHLVPSVEITDQMRDDLLYKGQERYSAPERGDSNINPLTGLERGTEWDLISEAVLRGDNESAKRMLEIIRDTSKLVTSHAEKEAGTGVGDVFRTKVTPEKIAADERKQNELIRTYGEKEQSKVSKAQRELHIPKKLDAETGVASGMVTAASSPHVSEPLLSDLIRALLNGDEGATYVIQSDGKTLKEAKAYFKTHGFTDALQEWRVLFNSGRRISKLDLVKAQQLFIMAAKDAPKTTESAFVAQQLAAEISAAATQAGQTVQAMTLLRKMSPAGKAYYLQVAVNRLNEQIAKNKSAKRQVTISINTELLTNLLAATTKQEMLDAEDALLQDIADQVPANIEDKWNALRYLGMLGNVRTHVRNLMGNAIFVPAQLAKNLMAAGVERVVDKIQTTREAKGLATGDHIQRTKSVLIDEAYWKFAENDFNEMQDILSGGGKYTVSDMIRERQHVFADRSKKVRDLTKVDTLANKLEQNVVNSDRDNALMRILKPVAKAAVDSQGHGFLNFMSEFNKGMLSVEDAFFLRYAYIRSLAGFLSAQGVDISALNSEEGTPDRDMRKLLNQARAYAVKEAQKATYRDHSELASVLNYAKQRLYQGNAVSKVAGVMLDGLLTFTTTPINIMRRGVEYSPVGLAKGIKQLAFDVRSNKVSAAEAVDQFCAGMTGTMITLVGFFLAKMGLLIGHIGNDEEDEFEKNQGRQSYALEVFGQSYTIDWAAPVALPLFIGAELANLSRNQDGSSEQRDGWDTAAGITDAFFALANPMLSLSMLDGLDNTLSAARYDRETPAVAAVALQLFSNYLSQPFPTAGGQLARTIDPFRRANYYEPGAKGIERYAKQFYQSTILGKTPGMSDKRMLYVDSWGRTETEGGVMARAFANFLSPGYANRINTTPVDIEIKRIADATNDTGVYPTKPAKSFTQDKVEYTLTADQYERFGQTRGHLSYDMINQLINSNGYNGLSDEAKALAVSYIYAYATEVAQLEVIGETGEVSGWMADMEWVAENGGDASEFLMIKAAADAATKANGERGPKVSMVEIAVGSAGMDAADIANYIFADTTLKTEFADPTGTSGRVYILSDPEHYSYYKSLYSDILQDEFADLFASRKYQNASVSERLELISKLKNEVGNEARKEMARWLRKQGVKSTKK